MGQILQTSKQRVAGSSPAAPSSLASAAEEWPTIWELAGGLKKPGMVSEALGPSSSRVT